MLRTSARRLTTSLLSRRALSATAAAAAVAATSAALCNERAEAEAGAHLSRNFIADAASQASPALVNIRVGNSFMQSSGSGFVVESSGLILTNTHVIRDAMRSGASSVSITLSDGHTQLQGIVQHADSASDIAIVKVSPREPLPTAKLGSSADLRPGEWVVALGAPAGLSNSVSAGIVSAVERTRSEIGLREQRGPGRSGTSYIQTDAAINSGNSGGPLLNLDGEVIGVNTMKAMGMDGIAFAVPIDEVKRVVGQLRRHGRVLRPYLGLKFVELDPQISQSLRRSSAAGTSVPDAGLYVMQVNPGSPAERGGVRVGDTITGMGSSSVSSTKELIDGLADQIGSDVTLGLTRDGTSTTTSVKVESMR